MKKTYILGLRLLFNPRDWHIAIINREFGTYGFQFLFFAVTFYIYNPAKPVFDNQVTDNAEPVKSFCCDKDILIGVKFKCKNCGSCNTEAQNKLTCTGCGTEVNQMGGKYIE